MTFSTELDMDYERIDANVDCFDNLPESVKKDLLDWFNVQHEFISSEELERLRQLYTEERFLAWTCPRCEDNRVYKADIRGVEWVHFQGTLNQDFASYPGDSDKYKPEYIEAMCDHCRCYK